MKNCLFIILLFASISASAQPTLGNHVPDRTKRSVVTNATIESILVNPRVLSNIEGVPIVSYSFSILPAKGDLIGPFTINGDKIIGKAMEGLLTQKGRSGKIFIDDISVKTPDGAIRKLSSIVVAYTN